LQFLFFLGFSHGGGIIANYFSTTKKLMGWGEGAERFLVLQYEKAPSHHRINVHPAQNGT
jgi:hypothetical protein